MDCEDWGPFTSDFLRYCQGAKNPNQYFLAVNVAISSVPIKRDSDWMHGLDQIVAFDLAEVTEANVGQINCVTVSSFCSPASYVWGFDVACAVNETNLLSVDKYEDGEGIRVFDGEPLLTASSELFGRGTASNFPFLPGTICPAAMKYKVGYGPCVMYSVLALGVPENRMCNAVAVMEGVGASSSVVGDDDVLRRAVRTRAVQSIMDVGRNQRVKYGMIFVVMRLREIAAGQMGCALAMAPYFALASQAFPHSGLFDLRLMTLSEWLTATKNK